MAGVDRHQRDLRVAGHPPPQDRDTLRNGPGLRRKDESLFQPRRILSHKLARRSGTGRHTYDQGTPALRARAPSATWNTVSPTQIVRGRQNARSSRSMSACNCGVGSAGNSTSSGRHGQSNAANSWRPTARCRGTIMKRHHAVADVVDCPFMKDDRRFGLILQDGDRLAEGP